MITERQQGYIKSLFSDFSKQKEDKEFLDTFLNKVSKSSIEYLSKREASDLIQGLINISVPHTFSCGKNESVPKNEANRFKAMGELDACLHLCEIDVHDCKYWDVKELLRE